MEESQKMEDKPIFDKAKADLGIRMACEQFDKLGLTLVERFWACHCILQAASGLLGEKYGELAEKLVKEVGEQPVADDLRN